MQLLEGNKETVLALRDRIRADTRHGDFRIVAEGLLHQRTFTDWGMVLLDLDHNGNTLDFAPWKKRTLTFADLADDPQLCHAFIAAHASSRP